MKNKKKLVAIVLTLSMVVASLTACGGKDKDKEVKPTTAPVNTEEPEATPVPTIAPVRDLGGIDIVVGDWWTDPTAETVLDQKGEDQLAYREELQTTHNFTLVQQSLGGWAEYQEIFITSTMAGAPSADVFIMDQAFCPEPIKQGLCYPLSDIPSFNFNDEKWNASVRDNYTQNGKVYGFSEDKDTPGLGVFFNKRLFEEAGLDGDLLYQLQAEGAWTWDKFHELAALLTKDNNSDGVTDTYGVVVWQREMVKAAVFSNGTDYVKYNEATSKYENNQMSEEFLAAIQLGVDFYSEGLIMPVPEDAEFTYFQDVFAAGQAAMCPTEWYRNSAFQEMEDDWGFVFYPKGPGANAKMQTMYVGNVRVMPAGMEADRADDVAFAYDKWISTVPGYENADPSADFYQYTRDERTVTETIAPMLAGQGSRSLVYMVPGLSFKHGANEDGGGLGDVSAIEIAEAASAIYEGLINDFYAE